MAVQPYPRDDKGFLDAEALQQHDKVIPGAEMRDVIDAAIANANLKSGRAILNISASATKEEVEKAYKRSGKGLFNYFLKFCGDPAATAHQCYRKHFADVAREQFRNRTLQKERMNSGWRYQFIAKDAATRSGRFQTVSDIGTTEADFNVTIQYQERPGHLTIYVSVKNRIQTMGGQDWPKAIQAMERTAVQDKNRTGAYLCVFGIAIERGGRMIKTQGSTGEAHSANTEIWRSDFFWPFFANYSYEAIMGMVLDVLIETAKPTETDVPVPDELVREFGRCCQEAGLVDDDGCFCDPHMLVTRICGAAK